MRNFLYFGIINAKMEFCFIIFQGEKVVGEITKTKYLIWLFFCVAFSSIIEYNNDKETGDLVSRCCLGVMQRSATAKNSL